MWRARQKAVARRRSWTGRRGETLVNWLATRKENQTAPASCRQRESWNLRHARRARSRRVKARREALQSQGIPFWAVSRVLLGKEV